MDPAPARRHEHTSPTPDDDGADRDDGRHEDEADVVVLGMGPGGEDVAGRLADAGLEVIGVEAGLVGGECPYWACIPSKMIVRAARTLAEAGRVSALAGHASVTPDWTPVARRIREATDDWDDAAAVERFEQRGGVLVRGRGRLVAHDTVEVDGRRIRARRAVVVATGSSAAVPPIEGLAGTPFWTNHEATEAADLPDSLLVLGGGPVGVELGQAMARFGVRVTIVERAERLLSVEEPAVGDALADVFAAEGIEVVTGAEVQRVEHDDRFLVRLADGRSYEAEQLLVATGRTVDLDAIGAEAIGIDTSRSALPVDPHLRVIDGIWAVGDVTGKGPFTHVAIHQARIAAADILGEPHTPADDAALPRVTFTDPEVGAVGLTEAQARERGIDVAIGRADVPSTTRGWIHGEGNDGIIQLVVDRGRGVLVGATSMGPEGGEVLGLLALAVHARVPLEELRTMIFAYPTFHRGIRDALEDLG